MIERPLNEGQRRYEEYRARQMADTTFRTVYTEEAAKKELWLQLVEKIPNPRSEPEHHAYLTNFYVEEFARGKSVGSQLLSTAIAWCETQDVHAVILWPTERSRSLYQRRGFAVRDDLMELLITGATPEQ